VGLADPLFWYSCIIRMLYDVDIDRSRSHYAMLCYAISSAFNRKLPANVSDSRSFHKAVNAVSKPTTCWAELPGSKNSKKIPQRFVLSVKCHRCIGSRPLIFYRHPAAHAHVMRTTWRRIIIAQAPGSHGRNLSRRRPSNLVWSGLGLRQLNDNQEAGFVGWS